jgi:hypothetical protein
MPKIKQFLLDDCLDSIQNHSICPSATMIGHIMVKCTCACHKKDEDKKKGNKMAVGVLPKPGSKTGPCLNECSHSGCQYRRKISESVCRLCHSVIGYDVRFEIDPLQTKGPLETRAYVHAVCLSSRSAAWAKSAPRK